MTTTGKDVLVPLTSSLYVSGTLGNPDNVMVDIGTGYYVEVRSEKTTQNNASRQQRLLTHSPQCCLSRCFYFEEKCRRGSRLLQTQGSASF